jgi:hypothetical protein
VTPIRIIGALTALMLGACQPLPQPFAEDKPPPDSPMLTLRDGAGIVVEHVQGADDAVGLALAEAVAKALRDADTPAETGGGNRASLHLGGVASAGEIRWHLAGPNGASAGDFVQRLEEPLAPGTAAAVAAAAAARIAELVQEDTPVAADGDALRVLVRPVEGAPGDGTQSLSRAMVVALKRADVAVARDDQPDGAFVLAGRVAIAQPVDRKQHVKITWELRRPGGEQIGQVNQENDVPAGTLDGAWGDIAYVVAGAASEGIVALIDKVKSAAAARS